MTKRQDGSNKGTKSYTSKRGLPTATSKGTFKKTSSNEKTNLKELINKNKADQITNVTSPSSSSKNEQINNQNLHKNNITPDNQNENINSETSFAPLLGKQEKSNTNEKIATDYKAPDYIKDAPDNLQSLLGLFAASLNETNPEVKQNLKTEFIAQNGVLTVDESKELANKMAIILAIEAHNAIANGNEGAAMKMQNKATKMEGHARAIYNKTLAAFNEQPKPKPKTEQKPKKTIERPLDNILNMSKNQTPEQELEHMQEELRKGTWSNQRKHHSKTKKEAKENLKAIMKKLELPENAKVTIAAKIKKEDAITIMDTIAQVLEEAGPEYLTNFHGIKIKHLKRIKGREEFSDEEMQQLIETDYADQRNSKLKSMVTENRINAANKLIKEKMENETSNNLINGLAMRTIEEELNNAYDKQELTGKKREREKKKDLKSAFFQGKLAKEKEKIQQLAKNNPEAFQKAIDKKMQTTEAKNELERRINMVQEHWKKQIDDNLKKELLANHFYTESGAEIDSGIKAGHSKYSGEVKLNIDAAERGFDNYHNLLTHEMGHIKSFTWADELLTRMSGISSGKHYINFQASENLGNTVLSKATQTIQAQLELAKHPDFKEFINDWKEVSVFSPDLKTLPVVNNNGKQIDEATVQVWSIKDGQNKADIVTMQDTAFGKQYASNSLNNQAATIGEGVREEIAEAYKMYKYPKRDQYIATLRKTGKEKEANYLTKMIEVIDKYEKKIQAGNIPSPLKEEKAARLAKKES